MNYQPEEIKLGHLNRLPAHPSHKINRNILFAFRFNGQVYRAFAGDTIVSALWAAGVRVLSRSFKYHRPRAAFAMTSGDTNTLVRVNDEPNVRASTRLVESGQNIKPQNVMPALDADLMALTVLGSRLLPVGFYYKTFIRPATMWPTYEKMLRNLAGLGYVTLEEPTTYYDKTYEFADLLVIGGGPAGLQAALSAANSGARVLLVDENPYLGGHLVYERQTVITESGLQEAHELGQQLAAQVEAHPNITVRLMTTAIGMYDHLWVGAVEKDCRLLKIRPKSVVVATGAFEQPFIFENNDLPGVMLGSAAQRLMHLYGVRPGRQTVVLSANRDGLRVALDLVTAGVEVLRVIELRLQPDDDLVTKLQAAQIPVETDRIITEAKGTTNLNGVMVARSDRRQPLTIGGLQPVPGSHEFVTCDLLITSVGWTPAVGLLAQAGARLVYDETQSEMRLTGLPPNVYAAGRVTGTHTIQAELLEGELRGRQAAQAVGFEAKTTDALQQKLTALKTSEPLRTSPVVYVPGGKLSFLSFDEDVTRQDLRDAIAEGYDSPELLKRYSTLGMGPSQGKYETANTLALCAEANHQPLTEISPTTSRPPVSPVPLGVLAGRQLEPVKLTPMHHWHVAYGAKMMNAGLWKRPEHYGNPTAEVLGTRHTLGLIDVSTLGKIELRGPDVPDLLERLYINQWRQLPVGRARYGVMVNEDGVIFDDGVVAHLADEVWYMTTTTGGANAVYEMIQWYLQSGWNFRVHLNQMTDQYAAMNLTGPQARQVLQPLTDLDLSNDAFPYMGARRGMVAGLPATILRIGFTGELGYEIHVAAGYGLYLWETLLEAGRPHGLIPFGVEAQRIMRLEKGHFIVGQDTDGLTDPLMAGLAWAVKLDKSDFVGRPSLVRRQQRGLTQKLVGFQMLNRDIAPQEGQQIVQPNPAWPIGLEILGRVTSARYSPTLKESIGLCWLPIERATPGQEFTIRIDGTLQTAQVVRLPFYDPAGERLKG